MLRMEFLEKTGIALATLLLSSGLVVGGSEKPATPLEQQSSEETFTQSIPLLQMGGEYWTGIALSNPSEDEAQVTMTAYGMDGKLLPLKSNPASDTLGPGQQIPRLASEYFGKAGKETIGWVEIQSDNPELLSFFQYGNQDVSKLDGGRAIPGGGYSLVVPISHGAAPFGANPTTCISLVNRSEEEILVALSPIYGNGDWVSISKMLPPKGGIYGTLEDILGRTLDDSAQVWVEIGGPNWGSGPPSLVGYILNETEESIMGTDAHYGNLHGKTLYSPQVVLGNGYKTVLRLFNEERGFPIDLRLEIRRDGGTELGNQVVRIPRRGVTELDLGELFGSSSSSDLVTGSLTISADYTGVHGAVLFGTEQGISAALPLATSGAKEFHFDQVANGAGAYTGLAIQNIEDAENELKLEVFDGQGNSTALEEIVMEPKARFARLLPELAPQTAGQVGGRIKLTAEHPIVAAELFGDVNLRSLSAVPGVGIEPPQEPLSLEGEWAVVADGGNRLDPELRVHLLRKNLDNRLEHGWSSAGLGVWTSWTSHGGVAVADFDGDGSQEIVHLSANYEISIFKNGSTGEPSSRQTLSGEFRTFWNLTCGDADNDGEPEIAVAMGNMAALLEWQGDRFVETWRSPPRGSYRIQALTIADSNGDGLNELLLPTQGAGLYIYDKHSGEWNFTRAEIPGQGTLSQNAGLLRTAESPAIEKGYEDFN
ncbi:MAG: VCBS repeat-containing protein, partial [Acidobacteriota bacterium]